MPIPNANLTQLGSVYDDPGVILLAADGDRRVADVNPAGCRLLGREVAALTGLRVDDLVAAGDRAGVAAAWEALARDGAANGEWDMVHADGTPVRVGVRWRADFAPGLHLGLARPVGPACRPVVLVAEDEDTVRGLVRAVLEANGFEVLVADSGTRAAEVAAETLPGVAVLLTDVRMPGMSGPELARHLRAARPDLPVVFMSGYVGDAVCGYDADLAASEFVPKPFKLDALVAAVRRALRPVPAAAV